MSNANPFTNYGPKPKPPLERMLAKVELDGDCWVFLGSRNAYGHGRVSVGSTAADGIRMVYAYRLMYESQFGPIPDGHEIHHLCYRPACVRPEHLVCLSRSDHIRIHGSGPCRQCGGIDFVLLKSGGRKCRACRKRQRRAYLERTGK